MDALQLTNVPNPKHDYLTGRGAAIMSDMIRDYWFERGHIVTVWADPLSGFENLYGIRSNLVNGMPPPEAV